MSYSFVSLVVVVIVVGLLYRKTTFKPVQYHRKKYIECILRVCLTVVESRKQCQYRLYNMTFTGSSSMMDIHFSLITVSLSVCFAYVNILNCAALQSACDILISLSIVSLLNMRTSKVEQRADLSRQWIPSGISFILFYLSVLPMVFRLSIAKEDSGWGLSAVLAKEMWNKIWSRCACKFLDWFSLMFMMKRSLMGWRVFGMCLFLLPLFPILVKCRKRSP